MFENYKQKASQFLNKARETAPKIIQGFLQAQEAVKKYTPQIKSGLEKVNQINKEIVKSDTLNKAYNYGTDTVRKIDAGSQAVDRARNILMN